MFISCCLQLNSLVSFLPVVLPSLKFFPALLWYALLRNHLCFPLFSCFFLCPWSSKTSLCLLSQSLVCYFSFSFLYLSYFVPFLSKSLLIASGSPLHPSPTLPKKNICINLPSFLCCNKLINETILFIMAILPYLPLAHFSIPPKTWTGLIPSHQDTLSLCPQPPSRTAHTCCKYRSQFAQCTPLVCRGRFWSLTEV